ncbi:shoot gravitropism 2 (SGR2) [Euphorbia peplus]|nr:shoot gravitropism 2 (SGR2) [Euphorbia peplus]
MKTTYVHFSAYSALKIKSGLTENDQGEKERTYGDLMMERLTENEDGRIDHMLQDKTFEHPYLQAIGAHTNYWRDFNTALFILEHLNKDIPEEENPSKGSSSNEESSSTGLSDQREVVEEERPLTLSDRLMIRNFRRKVKSSVNKS